MVTILITRNYPQSVATARRFKAQGYHCHINPLMKIIHFPILKLTVLPAFVVLTSPQAVLSLKKLDIPKDLPIFSIGKVTTTVLQTMEFTAIITAQGNSKNLQHLISAQKLEKKDFILYLRGYDITMPIYHPQAQVKNIFVYQAQLQRQLNPDTLKALHIGTITHVALFSKRMAQHFEAISDCYNFPVQHLHAWCLSFEIAKVLKKKWATIEILDISML